MNFEFSDQLTRLRDRARRFPADRRPPAVPRRIPGTPERNAADLPRAIGGMGGTGAAIPEPYGGAGFGGTTAELFGDAVHAPAPVDEAEATRMILSLKSARLLTGFRGRRPIDLATTATLIAALSRGALTLRNQVQEFELNPVIVHTDEPGLTVAGALLTMKPSYASGASGCSRKDVTLINQKLYS